MRVHSVVVGLVLASLTACATYTKTEVICDAARCPTMRECIARGQYALDAGEPRDAQCAFKAALRLDEASDDARMGLAFAILLAGVPADASLQYEYVRSHTNNPEMRDTATQYLDLLKEKTPVAVLYTGSEDCADAMPTDTEIAGKNLYRLVANIGLFSVPDGHPIRVYSNWTCCDDVPQAGLALLLTPRCEGRIVEQYDAWAGGGRTVRAERWPRWAGSVRIDLYDPTTRRLIQTYRARAETKEVLGDTTYLSWGKASASLILPIVRTILTQQPTGTPTAPMQKVTIGRQVTQPSTPQTFRVKCSQGGSFGGAGQYIFLNDCILTVSETAVTLRMIVGPGGVDYGFSVTPSKILVVSYQDAGPSYSVQWTSHRVTERPQEIHVRATVQEMDRHYKYREGRRDFYLYNPHSVTVGVANDGSVMIGGISHVACDACDDSLHAVYEALERVRNKQ